MPFTPFHFGVHTVLSFPLRKYIDVPTFILANVAIDIEPLLVLAFQLNYPLHGYCHTFLVSIFIGTILAIFMFLFKKKINKITSAIKWEYKPTLLSLILSGISGAWLHILFDAFLYPDIRPFFPFQFNPLYNLVPSVIIYWACVIAFIPAAIMWLVIYTRKNKNEF
jgi:hypothetical protein